MRRRIALLLGVALLGVSLGTGAVAADEPSTTVIDWNRYAAEALFNAGTADPAGAGQTPPVGGIHMAMVQIAVYDALNAIAGGYEPYLAGLPQAPASASQDAAVAVAAHHVLVGLGAPGNVPPLPASMITLLDARLAAALEDVPSGPAKNAGIAIGEAAAAAVLDIPDTRAGSFRFTPGTDPGEWRPTAADGANDPFAWVRDVTPFTLRSGSQYMAEGPPALDSAQYTAEFDEVKILGSAGSTVRTGTQTATALYFTENPFTLYNRSWRSLIGPGEADLSPIEAARLLAMTNVAGADAVIACWNNKARWSNWRPITAIRLAADDGNAATMADGSWTSLRPSPPYPDDTSGYNCGTGAHMYAAAAFFGTDKRSFSLVNASDVTRDYNRFTDVIDDTIDARVWLGIHFRFADVQGAWVGKKVGQWVGKRFFEPIR